MAQDERDPELTRWLEVTREAWQAQAAWGRASMELVRSAMGGELDTASASRAYAQAARREGTRYWRSASRLGAEYVRDIAQLGSAVATSVVDDVARSRQAPGHGHAHAPSAEPTRHPAAPPPPAPGAAGLTLRGSPGERASGAVTVVNRHPRARRIELSAAPLVDELGVELDAVIELDPARTTVPAGEERVVTVSCDLAAGTFEVGRTYRSTITVSGGEEATVVCVVAVD
ncbi:hypothetical protein ACPPVT_08730 [Angustibacter sp. McL0619]|uniref:hypothetical protein n=1 Tax=Angustibacter sp. McL0619 TaxID=3415676 RepID=UPI003CE9834A